MTVTPRPASRKSATVGVLGVPADHVVAGGGDGLVVVAAVHLQRAPGQPGLLGRREQHPDVGVGGDHGGDVAPLDHDAAVLGGDQSALPADQLGAHVQVGGDGADGGRDPRLADGGRQVLAVHGEQGRLGLGADLQRQLAGQPGHGRLVGRVHALRRAPTR